MITKLQIMPMLLEVCPAFLPVREKHVDSWQGQETGIYNDLSALVHFVIDSYERGETASFAALFDTIERFLSEEDQEIRDAEGWGFLETLRTASSWQFFGNEVFTKWPGTNSRRAWQQIGRTWRGKRSLADVIRAEAMGRTAGPK